MFFIEVWQYAQQEGGQKSYCCVVGWDNATQRYGKIALNKAARMILHCGFEQK